MAQSEKRLDAAEKALVLFSGGLDSSTLLAMMVDRYGANNVYALSIFYGQKHDRELEAARQVACYYGVEQRFLDLAPIFVESDSSLLASSSEAIPHETYAAQLASEDDTMASTYVPFRNGLFLSSAASIALSLDCSVMCYGAHADDWAECAYPDCSPAFVDAMACAIDQGTGGKLQLVAPFVRWSKARIVEEGLKRGVPYELTWSCYEGKDEPCGTCATCLDRQRAFELSGTIDPLLKKGN